MTKISGIDRIAFGLKLYALGRSYWPRATAGQSRKWLNDVVRPFVEARLGNGRIEDDAADAAILLGMDAIRANTFGFPPGDLHDAGAQEGNPWITLLGKLNNAYKHVLGLGGRERIGYRDIPPMYEHRDQMIFTVHSKVHRELGGGNHLKAWPEYEHVDVPWVLTDTGEVTEAGDPIYTVQFDEDYEFHPVARAILDKTFSDLS